MIPIECGLELALTFAFLVRKKSSKGEREGRESRGDESGGDSAGARKDLVANFFLDACAKQTVTWVREAWCSGVGNYRDMLAL